MGGRIYDRNEDADLDITDLTEEVARLYQRKQAAGQVTGQVTGQVGSMLLKLKTEKNKRELMVALKLTGRDNFEKLYLRPALDQGLIEMTVPGKPKIRSWTRRDMTGIL